jgi:leucyl aminopeptidase
MTPESDDLEVMLEVCQLSRYVFQDYKAEKKQKKIQLFCSVKDKKTLQSKVKTIENICLARDL